MNHVYGKVRRAAGQVPVLRNVRSRAIKTMARMQPAGSASKTLVTSFPKAGTHLLMEVLDALPGIRYSGLHIDGIVTGDSRHEQGSVPTIDIEALAGPLEQTRPGQYVTAHVGGAPPAPEIIEEQGFKVIFVCRDPRDIVVSTAAYIAKLRRHPRHRQFVEGIPTEQQRMAAVITGLPADEFGPALLPLRTRLERFLPWFSTPGAIVVRFEDLIGESGGGSRERQLEVVTQIARHTGTSADAAAVRAAASAAWSPSSATFNSGTAQGWGKHFDDELLGLFEEEIGADLLRAYGYD